MKSPLLVGAAWAATLAIAFLLGGKLKPEASARGAERPAADERPAAPEAPSHRAPEARADPAAATVVADPATLEPPKSVVVTPGMKPGDFSAALMEYAGKQLARGPDQRLPLGEELVRRGLVERSTCEAAARERERRPDGPRIGAILVQRGAIRRDDLEELIRERIKDAIYGVVDWRSGRFVFELGVRPEDEDIFLDVRLESLLLECMTRLDDARRAGPGSGERRA